MRYLGVDVSEAVDVPVTALRRGLQAGFLQGGHSDLPLPEARSI